MKQDSRTTRLLAFITALYPWAHGHQKKATAHFVAAVLDVKSCSQAALAGAFENKTAALKRLSRYLHNERLAVRPLAEGVAGQVVAQLARHVTVRIALDWTIEDQQHLLVASVLLGRRAVPLYWHAYEASTLKGHRSRYERAFVRQLIERVLRDLPRRQLLMTADRGFAEVALFDLFEALKVAFLIRTKENVKVYQDRQWRKLKTLRMRGNQRRRSLGRLRYCVCSPRRLYLTQSRARDRKGGWGVWWLVSNRHYSAHQAASEYARRWGCECGFRDAKHLLGFAEARMESARAYARMFTLVAIALLLLATIGCAFLQTGRAALARLRRVSYDRGSHSELSLFSAMLHLLKHDVGLWDQLSQRAKLNLEVTLHNVS